MNENVNDFSRYLDSKSQELAKLQAVASPGEYRQQSTAILSDYIRKSKIKARTAAKHAMNLARTDFFQQGNFERGITHASLSVAVCPSVVSLYARARMYLYVGKWQAALVDLADAIRKADGGIWLSKSRSLEAWCQLTYERNASKGHELLRQDERRDFVAYATACGVLCLESDWHAFGSAMAAIKNDDDRYVIVSWLRSNNFPLKDSTWTAGIGAGGCSARRMLHMVKLFQLNAALAECEKLIAVTHHKGIQARLHLWRSFLVAAK